MRGSKASTDGKSDTGMGVEDFGTGNNSHGAGLDDLATRDGAEPGFVAGVSSRNGKGLLLGRSPVFLKAIQDLPALAEHDLSVLILGETGTGKELVARAIHRLSRRRNKTFVPFNCATGTLELFDNLLFGHKRGAYSGADSDTLGLIGRAEGGSCFLDEMGKLSLGAQAKLLRFLEDKEVPQLGAECMRKADVLILAASNLDLKQAVQRGEFRSDLYHRLNEFELFLPPLRERGEDILLLAGDFMGQACARFRKPNLHFTDEACAALKAYQWPGNVRELRHVITRAVNPVNPVKTIYGMG